MKAALGLASLFGLLLAGCQLVLGFEDHVLLAGGGSPTGGGPEGGSGGGPQGGAPSGFGDPVEVQSGLGTLEAVAIGGSDVYVLEQTVTGYNVQRSAGGNLEVLASDLVVARGLETAGDEVLTTHGPTDQFDLQCHVSAFAGTERRDVMSDFCDAGENDYFALAVGGEVVAASFLVTQGNDHSDVRRASLAGGGPGTLIGLGEDDGEAVPSIAIDGASSFWVDSQRDDVMSSMGEQVTGVGNPPGDSVDTLAEGLSVLNEVVVTDGKVYVSRDDEVAQVNVGGSSSPLSEADSPRGLAADSSIVVWAEVDKVRAYVIASGEVLTLDEPDDEPTDVALSPSLVVYVTAGGRIVQIPRM